MTLDGASATVVAVRVVPGAARMWDLTVATTHTFAVGDAQAVVHNCNFGSNRSKIDWEEIESGHIKGGSRVSPRKTLFEGVSAKEVRGIVKEAWQNRVKCGEQQIDLVTGEVRQRWVGTAGRWRITGVYNHTTDTVESAWPLLGRRPNFDLGGFFRGN